MFTIIPTYTESNWIVFAPHFTVATGHYMSYKCDQWFIIDGKRTRLKYANTTGTTTHFQVMDREVV